MKGVGIEKINIYGSSLYLDQRKLAEARGHDPDRVVSDFMIDTRSVNPPWEDTVTLGANAALPLLSDEERDQIGLLVVGTESSVDFGKPISTNIHAALGLNPNVRNYETKHACYSGVAALDAAVNWVMSGLNRGRKALVISSDFSRMHLNMKEEFVLGGVSSAAIISDNPRVIEFEPQKKGTWTTDAYDTFRPSARHEVGNNEVSLYTYMDAIEGAYRDYMRNANEPVDFDTYFKYNVYHTPFAGMAFQAHRTLTNLEARRSKNEVRESFERRVSPVLRYAARVGSTYGASNFVGICSLLSGDAPVGEGDRIGFFAYGSGAIGEFYSGTVCPGARDVVLGMKIDQHLDERREVSVAEYERLETEREGRIEEPNIKPDFDVLDGWYDKHYKGQRYLVLREVKDFYRTYELS